MAYLTLFSYVILCDFSQVKQPNYYSTSKGLVISIPEVVLIIWTITFGLDEIRQVNLFYIFGFGPKFSTFTYFFVDFESIR